MAITPSTEIALRAHLSGAVNGRCHVELSELLVGVRATFPIMGRVVEPTDIARVLRQLRFYRDHSRKDVIAYEFRDLARERRQRAIERRFEALVRGEAR